MADATIPPADALALGSLLAYAEQGIASRVLAKTDGGNVTLFAFDTGQGLGRATARGRHELVSSVNTPNRFRPGNGQSCESATYCGDGNLVSGLTHRSTSFRAPLRRSALASFRERCIEAAVCTISAHLPGRNGGTPR